MNDAAGPVDRVPPAGRPVDTRPLRRWLATADRPTVLVACREHPHPRSWCAPGARPETEGAAVVYVLSGCLGELPPAALLEIAAAGVPEVVALLDGCDAPDQAGAVLAEAATIATALDLEQHLATHDRAPGESDGPAPAPRRGLARVARRRTAPLLDAEHMPVARRTLLAVPGSGDDAGLPAPESHPALRMRAVVAELLGARAVPAALDALPSGAAALAAPGCGGTGTCVQACPVQALSLAVTDLTGTAGTGAGERPLVPGDARRTAEVEQFVLNVDASRCIDCGVCVQVCPEGAMTRTASMTWSEVLAAETSPVRAGLVRRCARCGTAHRGQGDLCPVCTQRTRNPFGSQLPPGFQRPGR